MLNNTTSIDHVRTRCRESAYAGLAVIPPLAVFAILALGYWREHRTAIALQANFASLVDRNEPIGNATLTQVFDSRTTRTTTDQWAGIVASSSALVGKFEGLSEPSLGELVPPGNPWTGETLANQISQEAQVVLDQFRSLSVDDKPTWQPLLFDSVMTLLPELQDSRNVRTILSNEFRVAYHAGEHQRAVDALQMMLKLENAFDWQFCLVEASVRITRRQQRYELIRDSLGEDFWREQDLNQLLVQLRGTENLDQRWHRLLAGERAMILSALRIAESGNLESAGMINNVNFTPFGIAPTHQAVILRVMQKMQSSAGIGTGQHVRDAQDYQWYPRYWDTEMNQFSVTSMPLAFGDEVGEYYLPAIQAASDAFARSDENRRMTITAVGIKLFEVIENQWPSSLAELSRVGIANHETMVDVAYGNPFGYRKGKLGQEAILWTSPDSFAALYHGRSAGDAPPSRWNKTDADAEIRIR